MPTPTYTSLQTTTLGSSASSVTFSSIPATYRDLICVVGGQAASDGSLIARFNGDSAAHYSYMRIEGNGSSINASFSASLTFAVVGRMSGSVQSTNIFQIMDYSATDKHKIVVGRGSAPDDYVRAVVSRWPSTAAITSIEVYKDGANLDAGTVVSLYGIES